MATFNKLNVNEGANLQKLIIGEHSGNFDNKFLDVSDGKFTFYSNIDQNNNNNELLTLQQSDSNKGSLASKAETVSFEAGTSVTLQGASADNKLELTSAGAVLKGGSTNQLSLTSAGGAVLKGGTGQLTINNQGVEASKLFSSAETTLGGTININDGTTINYGGNKMTLEMPNDGVTPNKFTSKSVNFELQKKLDVKQSGGSTSLFVLDNVDNNTMTVNANTTFKNIAGNQDLMTLDDNAVTVPAGATFNSKQATTLSGTTTLEDSESVTLLTASKNTDDVKEVKIGDDVKFTSPSDTDSFPRGNSSR